MGPVDSVSVLALSDWAAVADIVAQDIVAASGVAASGVAGSVAVDTVADSVAVPVVVALSIVIRRFYLQLNSYYA